MIKNKIFNNIKKYSIVFCLTGAVAFAPVCSANARSYHHGDTLVAAAVGGAVAGLVGAVVQNTLNPVQTVVVEQPAYYVEPAPVIIREPYYYRPVHPVKHVRYHHRHR